MVRKAASRRRIWVIHGPNLNMLGEREPAVYGSETLESINQRLIERGRSSSTRVECFQSNHEGELIERIQSAKREGVRMIILNPGGLTHTSVALRDALAAVAVPFIEVHLSNIYAREPFRRTSYFSDIAVGTICGLGSRGYDLAMQCALEN
jgi:3-dehydroquinate dehydratase-2